MINSVSSVSTSVAAQPAKLLVKPPEMGDTSSFSHAYFLYPPQAWSKASLTAACLSSRRLRSSGFSLGKSYWILGIFPAFPLGSSMYFSIGYFWGLFCQRGVEVSDCVEEEPKLASETSETSSWGSSGGSLLSKVRYIINVRIKAGTTRLLRMRGIVCGQPLSKAGDSGQH